MPWASMASMDPSGVEMKHQRVERPCPVGPTALGYTWAIKDKGADSVCEGPLGAPWALEDGRGGALWSGSSPV